MPTSAEGIAGRWCRHRGRKRRNGQVDAAPATFRRRCRSHRSDARSSAPPADRRPPAASPRRSAPRATIRACRRGRSRRAASPAISPCRRCSTRRRLRALRVGLALLPRHPGAVGAHVRHRAVGLRHEVGEARARAASCRAGGRGLLRETSPSRCRRRWPPPRRPRWGRSSVVGGSSGRKRRRSRTRGGRSPGPRGRRRVVGQGRTGGRRGRRAVSMLCRRGVAQREPAAGGEADRLGPEATAPRLETPRATTGGGPTELSRPRRAGTIPRPGPTGSGLPAGAARRSLVTNIRSCRRAAQSADRGIAGGHDRAPRRPAVTCPAAGGAASGGRWRRGALRGRRRRGRSRRRRRGGCRRAAAAARRRRGRCGRRWSSAAARAP